MFDIGGAELLVIAVLGLIVIGPKRLPEVVRAISLWIGRLKRSLGNIKQGIENEFQLDEVRRQLHNEEILRQLEASKKEMEKMVEQSNPEGHHFEPLPRDDKPEDSTTNTDPPGHTPKNP
ncbi:Sec-independent protein translocase protein TatB [Porticoccus sp. W117]|uniref:Sec-independent protein translocase protein TatB n=1 Tax=Porticoccus sp. W117 TaxID=3054777 RepID=UPI0025970B8A|nr:Sec-independent protein translocase protein TatB [Porticoccus sp. W117]MDM3871584.1 Sec-independent protein translocase protein TatB [Porticoccus sp. W117]